MLWEAYSAGAELSPAEDNPDMLKDDFNTWLTGWLASDV